MMRCNRTWSDPVPCSYTTDRVGGGGSCYATELCYLKQRDRRGVNISAACIHACFLLLSIIMDHVSPVDAQMGESSPTHRHRVMGSIGEGETGTLEHQHRI
jgi:hypothetical protein